MEKTVPGPIPYADPSLPIGPSGFQPMAYPSDGAGCLGGRIQDDGVCLSLIPSRPINVRLIPFMIVVLIWAVGALIYLPEHRQPRTPLWASRVIVGTVVSVALLVFYLCLRSPSRDHRAWITVDRKHQRIVLPRGKRSLLFAQVVRLRLVSFSRVGVSGQTLTYRKKPLTGELQIVFHEAGREETWPVVFSLHGPLVKQFSVAFRQITGIPVSRAYRNLIGEWQVEQFDGD